MKSLQGEEEDEEVFATACVKCRTNFCRSPRQVIARTEGSKAAKRNSVVYQIQRTASVLTYSLICMYLLISGFAKDRRVAK